MFHTVLLVTFFLVGSASVSAIAADDHIAVSADQLKWGPAPPAFPKGAQFAVVAGDPTKEGLYVFRLRLQLATRCPRTCIPTMKTSQLYPGRLTSGRETPSMKKMERH